MNRDGWRIGAGLRACTQSERLTVASVAAAGSSRSLFERDAAQLASTSSKVGICNQDLADLISASRVRLHRTRTFALLRGSTSLCRRLNPDATNDLGV